MPGRFRGGFNAAQVLDQFMQLQHFKEFIAQRKEHEANLAAERGPGALAHVLEQYQRLRPALGENPSEEDLSALRESIISRQQMSPEAQPRARDIITRAPSLVREKRVQDLRDQLMLMGQKFFEQDKQNEEIMAYVNRDPKLKELFGNAFNTQKQERLQMYQNLIGLGYRDIIGDPDVQQMLRDALQQTILGGAPGTGTQPPPPGLLPQGAPQAPGTMPMPPAFAPSGKYPSLIERQPQIYRTPGGMGVVPR